MLHAKPRLAVDVGMDILFVIAELDVVPLGIIKRLRHDSFVFSVLIVGQSKYLSWDAKRFLCSRGAFVVGLGSVL